MSVTAETKTVTPPEIASRKGGTPIVCLTAYTTPMARLVDDRAHYRRYADRALARTRRSDLDWSGVAAALRFSGNGFRNSGERMGMRLNLLHERMNVFNRPRRRIGGS